MSVKMHLEKRDCCVYPSGECAYSPHIRYPEYPYSEDTLSHSENNAYDMVRSTLHGMGLDADHYNTLEWNPLGDLVGPERRILLKPNWVRHYNSVGSIECMITHPSVVRCLLDYCVIAKAKEIVLGDAPVQGCDINELWQQGGYQPLLKFIDEQDIPVVVKDFRRTIAVPKISGAYIQENNSNLQSEDVLEFDLGKHSYHDNQKDNRYRITVYDDKEINRHHNRKHHRYLIHRDFFLADLVINIPKPKTHRFAGLTGAQKNFIGICADKEYLPHYREGSIQQGGDETTSESFWVRLGSVLDRRANTMMRRNSLYGQRLVRILSALAFRIESKLKGGGMLYRSGQWFGNDTIWRTILDVNMILLYGKQDGSVDTMANPKSILTVADMIIAGEKSGPLEPSDKVLGIIAGSTSLAAFDYLFCQITGFAPEKIATVRESIISPLLLRDSINNIYLSSNISQYHNVALSGLCIPSDWNFAPNPYWSEYL